MREKYLDGDLNRNRWNSMMMAAIVNQKKG